MTKVKKEKQNVWAILGVSEEVRKMAKEKAKENKQTIGEYIERLIMDGQRLIVNGLEGPTRFTNTNEEYTNRFSNINDELDNIKKDICNIYNKINNIPTKKRFW